MKYIAVVILMALGIVELAVRVAVILALTASIIGIIVVLDSQRTTDLFLKVQCFDLANKIVGA